MIEARGLTRRFGLRLAVDDLNFRVRPGVVTGFLGPKGPAKATLMRSLTGREREVPVAAIRYLRSPIMKSVERDHELGRRHDGPYQAKPPRPRGGTSCRRGRPGVRRLSSHDDLLLRH